MTRSEISKASKQMSLLEDFHVNRSQSLESEKEQMTTDTSGMKLLELLPKQTQAGLLAKMLKALLTSPKVRSCNKYKKIWKAKTSKSNVLLFQLQVSVLGTKEKEFGLLPTPRACDLEGGVVKNVELKNGSFIVGNCHAGEANPQIFEITRDKKVVWEFDEWELVGNGLAVWQILNDKQSKRLRKQLAKLEK